MKKGTIKAYQEEKVINRANYNGIKHRQGIIERFKLIPGITSWQVSPVIEGFAIRADGTTRRLKIKNYKEQ